MIYPAAGSDYCKLTVNYILGNVLFTNEPNAGINLSANFILQNSKAELINYQIPEFFLENYTGKCMHLF